MRETETCQTYTILISAMKSAGLRFSAQALRDMYGPAGEIIYALQKEIDRLSEHPRS